MNVQWRNAEHAFPRLDKAIMRRVVLEPSTVIYALGDEQSSYPFQHVCIELLRNHLYTVKWYISILPFTKPDIRLKEQHFMSGYTHRRESMEVYAMAVLDELNVAHGGDLLRSVQRRQHIVPHTFMTAMWRDVMTIQIERLRSQMESGCICVNELERMAYRMCAYHPVPRVKLCQKVYYSWLFWWRFAYRYPMFSKRERRLIANHVKEQIKLLY